MPAGYVAKAEHVIIFTVTAWNASCPQHIPVRFDADTVQAALQQRDQRVQELEATIAKLRHAGGA